MVEQASGVVQNVAIDLAKRNHSLQWVTERVVDSDHTSNDERKRSPADLCIGQSVSV